MPGPSTQRICRGKLASMLGRRSTPSRGRRTRREVISFGFWFGDDTFPDPAFYSYTAPEPGGLAGEPLRPPTANWVDRGGRHLAVLRYDDARAETDPRRAVLNFFESAYRAGARLAGWDVPALASLPASLIPSCPNHTDPHSIEEGPHGPLHAPRPDPGRHSVVGGL